MPDQLSQILALACELGAHFAHVVHPCEEHKRCPRLRLISIPHGGHEPAVMLTHILIEEIPRDVCSVHEVLGDGQPGGRTTAGFGPHATSKVGQFRNREGRLRGRKNRWRRNRARDARLDIYFLSGHRLSLESISLPKQPKHATMSESGYSEIVEPGIPGGAAITPRG